MKAYSFGFFPLMLSLVAACSLVDTIPPKASTVTAIGETHVRMQMYIAEHRDYPGNLSELPTRQGYSNRTTDGWGRPLAYSVDDQGYITLSSLGRDGKPGGTGDDADIVRHFITRNEDGSLNVDDKLWTVTSEIRGEVE